MKLPRNLSGEDLIKALRNLGYETTRQTGSHIRLTTQENGEHNLTIPAHNPIKVGTLKALNFPAVPKLLFLQVHSSTKQQPHASYTDKKMLSLERYYIH